MSGYTYRETEDGDLESCALCHCEAPLDEFEIQDIPTKFARKQAGEPTTHLLCEVCACTYCGTLLGTTASATARELGPHARMIAETANLLLDKILARRDDIRRDLPNQPDQKRRRR
jgi:hypothetical protein